MSRPVCVTCALHPIGFGEAVGDAAAPKPSPDEAILGFLFGSYRVRNV